MGSLPVTISLHPLPYPTSTHPTAALPMLTLFFAATAASQPEKLATPTAAHSLHLIFTTRCSETASEMTLSSTIAAKTSHNFSLLTNLWLLSYLFLLKYNFTSLLGVCADWPVPVSGLDSFGFVSLIYDLH